MTRLTTRMLPVILMTAGISTPVWADGFRSYRVCGGDQFTTCAAIEINVVGTDVTVRLWNLSGNFPATSTSSAGSTVFNAIGFYNVPAGVQAVTSSFSMSGPARPGDAPGDWQLTNGTPVAFFVDYAAGNGNTLQNGIASGCAAPGELPSGVDLYQNPCSDPSGDPGSGWITLNFQISGGSWDPNTSDVVVRGANMNGGRTECWTNTTPDGFAANCHPAAAVPEPVTMTLLATGLAGMGGAGFMRRRRKSAT